MSKKCGKCRETKELGEFNKNKTLPDGLQNSCRPCQAAAKRKWKSKRTRADIDKSNAKDYITNKRRNRERREKNPQGMTYLITDGLAYKIGITRDKEEFNNKRLRQLQNGNPRKLTLLLWSERDIELHVHHEFIEDRLIGEWFSKSQEILDFFTITDGLLSQENAV